MCSHEKTAIHTRVCEFLSVKMAVMGIVRKCSSSPPLRTNSEMPLSPESRTKRTHCALGLLRKGFYSKKTSYEIFDTEEGADLSLAPRKLFDLPLPERTSAESVLVSTKKYDEMQGKMFPHLSRVTLENQEVYAKKFVGSRRDAPRSCGYQYEASCLEREV